jgi:hypothetical protein
MKHNFILLINDDPKQQHEDYSSKDSPPLSHLIGQVRSRTWITILAL